MNSRETLSRRKWFERAAGAATFGSIFKLVDRPANGQPIQAGGVNRNSAPSQLKITDMRACTVAANYDYPIIRIDTNQGVYGLGEVRDAGVKGIALMLKAAPRGQEPAGDRADPRQASGKFAGQRRMGGGYSAVDMALHDIAGKVYGVPCWRLIGAKYRDRIRIYCDTDRTQRPEDLRRAHGRGGRRWGSPSSRWTWTPLVRDKPGAVNHERRRHREGLKLPVRVHRRRCATASAGMRRWRADHFGRLDVNDSIRYARAFEPYELAWAEDRFRSARSAWRRRPENWRAYKEIKEATTTPIITGESLFGLEEGFRPFIENRAVDIIHPDPLTSGALRETKRIADYASLYGIPTALHFAGSPVGCMASVHMVATIKDFVAMENHAVDMPWWGDLVTGLPKPIIQNGYIQVPDTPGLGVELNEEVVQAAPAVFRATSSRRRSTTSTSSTTSGAAGRIRTWTRRGNRSSASRPKENFRPWTCAGGRVVYNRTNPVEETPMSNCIHRIGGRLIVPPNHRRQRGPIRLLPSLSASLALRPVGRPLESETGRNKGMSLSQLARSISESPTLKLNETAALLREKGEPVIHLGGGEPKSKTPIDAIVSCTALLNTGDVKYTPADGIPALKKAIIRYTEEHYGRLVGAGQRHRVQRRQAVDHGAAVRDPRSQGRSRLPGALLGELPGDGQARRRRAGGGASRRTAPSSPPWRKSPKWSAPTPRPSSSTARTTLAAWSTREEFIAEIVEFCEKKSLYLIMDDTYNRLIFDGQTPTNCYEYAKDLTRELQAHRHQLRLEDVRHDRLPHRLGGGATRKLVAAMTNIQSQQTSGPATPSQWAAVGALNGVQSSIESLRMTLENNRNVMMERLDAFPA